VQQAQNRNYRHLSQYWRERFGERVQKVPLDAGFGCPNRDGSLSAKGCIFCNELGSGTGLGSRGLSLAEQWEAIVPRLKRKYKTRSFIAYLQSYTNTYGPQERIAQVVGEVRVLPGVKGLCIGTRPDCIDKGKLDVLAWAGFDELWLEMGLQSASDETLLRINRGHDSACFKAASKMAAERGIKVCAHLIAGLPGEGREAFLRSVEFVAGLPVAGVKFHNVYVCQGTALAHMWRRGEFTPPTRERYAAWVAEALPRLAPGTVVHRLVADPAYGELLAPDWAADKQTTLRLIEDELARRMR
jgi:hypothetical protein